jgi:Cu(I)/Ag(I) efflux system membrane fusion protein
MIVLVACAGVAVATTAWLLLRHESAAPIQEARCGNAAPAYWYDPMHATTHFDKPGKSPFMEMQLVPKCPETPAASQGRSTAKGSIAIDSRMVQTLGIRLSPVEEGSFARGVDTVGLVVVDEHGIQAVQVREPGWVEELHVRAAGDPVRRGERLAGIYSPQLLASQQEFLIARDSQDPQLIEGARRRLTLLGLSDAQIGEIERTGRAERRVSYYAPIDGFVMELGVRQGAAVEPGTMLFQLAALSTVWVTAEVPETQAGWIKPGDPAQLTVAALPGERFTGKVDYLYPELSQATRSLKVRIVVENRRERLRPGMFATVHFQGAALEKVLTVPSEAVIKTGLRSIVIVADDGTHFHPVLVRVGSEHGERSEILDGLRVGEQVVASGQFLIDSEASLRGAFENLAGASTDTKIETKPELMPAPSASPTDGSH